MPVFKDEERNTFYVKTYYTDYSGIRKQKMKRGFKLQRDAKEWERSFLEKQQGTPDMTFRTLYELYVEDMSHRLRDSTLENKRNVAKNHIVPYFQNKPINQITAVDIRAWQSEQIKAGYSLGFLNRIQCVLTSIFNYAVKYYDLPVNPCSKAGRMGKLTRSMNFWTLDQFNEVISHVSDISAKTALILLFYSGMRSGEMLALTYGDFDFNANTISVTKTLQYIPNRGIVVTSPKTENSTRIITMPESVMNIIKDYTSKMYGISDSDRVFTFSKETLRNRVRRASNASGVPVIRIHDLRHSHVSLLIDMGFSPHLIAERIGDNVQMVNNTYGHLYPTKHKEVAEMLDKLVSF